jgi:hypothetical protein
LFSLYVCFASCHFKDPLAIGVGFQYSCRGSILI